MSKRITTLDDAASVSLPQEAVEVGMAHTLGKPTLLLTSNINDVPFDLRSVRLIVYESTHTQTTRLELERAIQSVLGEDRLDEAKRLVDGGMYRAAAAVAGVFLEHALRRLQEKYGRQLNTRSVRRPPGLSQGMQLLAEAGIIETADVQMIKRAIEIRNRAVHDLAEPTAEDVQFMLSVAREFKTKYLGYED